MDEHEHTPAPSEAWRRRARRLVLHHGLAATKGHVRVVAEALLEAHVEAAELAIEGRAPAPLPPVNGHMVEPPAETRAGGIAFAAAVELYVSDRMRDPASAWTRQTEAQQRLTFRLAVDHFGTARVSPASGAPMWPSSSRPSAACIATTGGGRPNA